MLLTTRKIILTFIAARSIYFQLVLDLFFSGRECLGSHPTLLWHYSWLCVLVVLGEPYVALGVEIGCAVCFVLSF